MQPNDMNEVIMKVEGLTVVHQSGAGNFNLVDDISFAIHKGEIFALIGESAAGKTTIALALTNLFHRYSNLAINGRVFFLGKEITGLSEDALSRIRADSVRHIFQEPGQSFNPVARIGKQFSLARSSAARSNDRCGAAEQAEWLARVGIENPSAALTSYPHQLSGGMLQRILIAMAMAGRPELLLADEPTSSLDAGLKWQIMDLLESFRKEFGTSIVLITHDLDLAQRTADTVAVLYSGQIVEVAGRESFFRSPMHPYSQALLDGAGHRAAAWRNDAPATQVHPSARPSGCRFQTRCPKARNECGIAAPPLEKINDTTEIRCLFWR
jgi:oligopeptide/dipeptide ABC transporter ATP-binding protein